MPSMTSRIRPIAIMIMSVAVAATVSPAPARAGVISQMLAKHRSQRKAHSHGSGISHLPANPFHGQGVGGDIGASSFGSKFKNRFALKGNGQGMTSINPAQSGFTSSRDNDVFKSSR